MIIRRLLPLNPPHLPRGLPQSPSFPLNRCLKNIELQISRNFENSFSDANLLLIKNFGTNNQSKMKRLTTKNYIPNPTKRNL